MGHYPDHSPKPNIKSRNRNTFGSPSRATYRVWGIIRSDALVCRRRHLPQVRLQIKLRLLPCLATQLSTSPRHQTASSSCASPSPHIGRRISTAPRRRDTPPSMSRMKHRSAETGRASEDQSAAKQPKHHIHPKLTKNDTPKKVTTPGAPLSLNPAWIWAFARHTSWV